MAGVTSTGFVSKTVSEVQTDTEGAVREVYGAQANVDPRSRVGQFIGVLSDALSQVWELAEAVAAALDPNSATGVLLDNLAALTATVRQAATSSTVDVTFTGTNGSTVIAGKQVGETGTEFVFETTAGGTLATATDADTVGGFEYFIGDTVKSDGSIWRVIAPGFTTSGNPPTGAGPTFTDDDLVWQRLGTGSAFVDVATEATITGPTQAFAGSITTILTPISGVSGVFNSLDADVGRNLETDTELRARRALEVSSQGTSTLPGIRAEILKLTGVETVVIYENITDATVDSIPPHAFEALVEGGDQDEIAQTILVSKPAGIATYGNVAETGITSDGVTRDVFFSRPVPVNVYIVAAIVKDPNVYPAADGDTLIEEALALWGDALPAGRDVVAAAISAQIFLAVPGVLDVTYVHIGTAPSPATSTTIVMTSRQRANYDTTRIAVSSTDGTP